MLGCASAAVLNQAPAKSAPGLGPSGFPPHAFARKRAARSACLRSQATCAPSCRTVCLPIRELPGGPPSSFGSARPDVLSAAVPCLQGAFAAYPRAVKLPCGIPRHHARGPSLDRTGLPRPSEADEQIHHRQRAPGRRGFEARCASAVKSVYFPL